MAITRLQQARQMYAMGQRVGGIMGSNAGSMLVTPTRDGSRPGYYGPDAGHENDPGHGSNAPGGNGDARDKAIANQYKNMPTPTVTVGVDKFDNPIEVKTTYTDRRNRQKTLDALNKQGISSFDPRITNIDPNNLVTSFAPTKTPFNFKNLATNIMLGIVAPQLLGSKVATGIKAFNTAKTLSKFATDIGLTDKNVVDAFTSNFTEKFGKGKTSTAKSTTKNNINNGDNGNGIASLDNQASGYDEYILLLQKLQAGTISNAERNRYNVLKNMLGI